VTETDTPAGAAAAARADAPATETPAPAPPARPRRRLGPVAACAGLVALTAGLVHISPVTPEEDVPGQALFACRADVTRQAPALTDERWLIEVIDDAPYGHRITGFLGPAGWACAASYDGDEWDVEVTVEAPEGVSLTEESGS
jgi:hypothetical protein